MWVASVIIILPFTSGCSTTTAKKPHAAASSLTVQDQAAATRQAVLAGYTGMWSDLEKDALTSNWQNPTIVQHATGKALLNLDESLAADNHLGLVGKGHAVLHPMVVSMNPEQSPTTATVADCADFRNFLKYVASTGALENNKPGGMHFVQATLLNKSGVWKVSELAIGAVGSC
jgi:hypothetical protein